MASKWASLVLLAIVYLTDANPAESRDVLHDIKPGNEEVWSSGHLSQTPNQGTLSHRQYRGYCGSIKKSVDAYL